MRCVSRIFQVRFMFRKYFQWIFPVKDNVLTGLERLEGICKDWSSGEPEIVRL